MNVLYYEIHSTEYEVDYGFSSSRVYDQESELLGIFIKIFKYTITNNKIKQIIKSKYFRIT